MWVAFRAETRQALKELDGCSDRVLAIVAGALVDSVLTDILKKELSPATSARVTQVQANFFQPEGPLGNFGAKISLAYLLGFLTEEAYLDLLTFKYIRNLFAHYSEHNSFDVPKIKDRCANFKLVDSRTGPPSNGVIQPDGKKELTGTISMDSEHPGLKLGLPDYDELKSTPRGRFLGTAKLFCANLEVFSTDSMPGLKQTKPII
jgi:hypothetical protein